MSWIKNGSFLVYKKKQYTIIFYYNGQVAPLSTCINLVIR